MVDLLEVELPVPVGVEDPILRRFAVTSLQRPAISQVGTVVNRPDPRMLSRKAIRDLPGSIPASVVDNDDLVVRAEREAVRRAASVTRSTLASSL